MTHIISQSEVSEQQMEQNITRQYLEDLCKIKSITPSEDYTYYGIFYWLTTTFRLENAKIGYLGEDEWSFTAECINGSIDTYGLSLETAIFSVAAELVKRMPDHKKYSCIT